MHSVARSGKSGHLWTLLLLHTHIQIITKRPQLYLLKQASRHSLNFSINTSPATLPGLSQPSGLPGLLHPKSKSAIQSTQYPLSTLPSTLQSVLFNSHGEMILHGSQIKMLPLRPCLGRCLLSPPVSSLPPSLDLWTVTLRCFSYSSPTCTWVS